MKILITGPHGFVGTNISAYLSSGNTIYGVARESVSIDGVEHVFTWDEFFDGKVPDVDAVVHLAGKAHDTKNLAGADVYYNVNRDLTIRVYDWFLQSQAKKFIFFSSVKAVADKVVGVELTEDAKPSPVGPYGCSKYEAEQYIMNHPAEGKQVYILRPCMMHGPGNKGNLNLLYKVVSKGLPWPLGAFQNRRSFASIGNVSYVVGRLITEDIPTGIYNMSDDEALSTNQLIDIICLVLNLKPKIWHISRGLMNACAKIGGVLHLPLNPERLAKLTENYVVDNSKLKRALGIKAMPIKTADGLALTIKSFADKTI